MMMMMMMINDRHLIVYIHVQLGGWFKSLGSRAGQSVSEVDTLRRNAGSRRSNWRHTHGSDTERNAHCHTHCTGRPCKCFVCSSLTSRDTVIHIVCWKPNRVAVSVSHVNEDWIEQRSSMPHIRVDLTCIQNSNRRFEIISAQLQNFSAFALVWVGSCPGVSIPKFVGRIGLGWVSWILGLRRVGSRN